MKPDDVVDRVHEWQALESFATSTAPGLRIGVLSGRRRTGKSYLLRRLAAMTGGIYHMALEEEQGPALRRFADRVARQLRVPAGALRFDSWEQALRAATGVVEDGPVEQGLGVGAGGGLLVLDELPYLLRGAAGAAIPSALQLLVDDSRARPGPPRRVLVCGSAMAVMTELLSGTKALRGRAELDLLLTTFDYRTAGRFYEAPDAETAFALHAFLGGSPGYKDLLPFLPADRREVDRLVASTLLDPSHALFGEAGYLLREDPRVTDRAMYRSVLAAVAAGAHTPTAIGARVGRDARSLAHALEVLTTAGFVVREEDVLLQRRPRLRLADPVIAFHELVTAPRLVAFEDRRTEQGWADARATVEANILGPHFEHLAREWVRRFAAPASLGGEVGEVGSTVVNDPAGRSQHEVDVVALAPGRRRAARNPTVLVLGEAKASARQRGTDDLVRLDRVRATLVARGVDAGGARLLLFGRNGFTADLSAAAARRSDVELVDLQRLYGGD